jgi:putative DNA-invertase from lambdoid prophage Rac
VLGWVKALGYARVSVPEERVENQVQAIEEFCRANGLELLKVFMDIGVSGAKPAFEREGFRQLLEASRLLGVKTIVIYDLTRLGRDLFDLIETYRKLLEEGYTILFVKHPELNASPDSPIGEALRKALLTILGVVAELERAFIRERTRAGLERAKREGKRLGRKPVEIPLDLVKRYQRMGLTKKAIYELLVSQGYLRYREKGETRVLSYDRFVKRLKALGL